MVFELTKETTEATTGFYLLDCLFVWSGVLHQQDIFVFCFHCVNLMCDIIELYIPWVQTVPGIVPHHLFCKFVLEMPEGIQSLNLPFRIEFATCTFQVQTICQNNCHCVTMILSVVPVLPGAIVDVDCSDHRVDCVNVTGSVEVQFVCLIVLNVPLPLVLTTAS